MSEQICVERPIFVLYYSYFNVEKCWVECYLVLEREYSEYIKILINTLLKLNPTLSKSFIHHFVSHSPSLSTYLTSQLNSSFTSSITLSQHTLIPILHPPSLSPFHITLFNLFLLQSFFPYPFHITSVNSFFKKSFTRTFNLSLNKSTLHPSSHRPLIHSTSPFTIYSSPRLSNHRSVCAISHTSINPKDIV